MALAAMPYDCLSSSTVLPALLASSGASVRAWGVAWADFAFACRSPRRTEHHSLPALPGSLDDMHEWLRVVAMKMQARFTRRATEARHRCQQRAAARARQRRGCDFLATLMLKARRSVPPSAIWRRVF